MYLSDQILLLWSNKPFQNNNMKKKKKKKKKTTHYHYKYHHQQQTTMWTQKTETPNIWLIVYCCLYSNASVSVYPKMLYSYIWKGNNFVSFRQWYIPVYAEALSFTVVRLREFHATVTKNTSAFVHSIEKKSQ